MIKYVCAYAQRGVLLDEINMHFHKSPADYMECDDKRTPLLADLKLGLAYFGTKPQQWSIQ